MKNTNDVIKDILEKQKNERKRNFIQDFYALLDSYKDISSFEKKIIFAQCNYWYKEEKNLESLKNKS